MFTVNLDGREYKVFFRYGSDRPSGSRKDKRYTECVISRLDLEVDDKKYYTVVDSYKEYCSPLDNFEKNRGRKLALANLLKKLNYPKETRILFWDAYFKSRGLKEVIKKHSDGFYADLVPNY